MATMCDSFSSIFLMIVFYEITLGDGPSYLKIVRLISLEMFDTSWGYLGDHEVA